MNYTINLYLIIYQDIQSTSKKIVGMGRTHTEAYYIKEQFVEDRLYRPHELYIISKKVEVQI